jgi:hypothetical protein
MYFPAKESKEINKYFYTHTSYTVHKNIIRIRRAVHFYHYKNVTSLLLVSIATHARLEKISQHKFSLVVLLVFQQ